MEELALRCIHKVTVHVGAEGGHAWPHHVPHADPAVAPRYAVVTKGLVVAKVDDGLALPHKNVDKQLEF